MSGNSLEGERPRAYEIGSRGNPENNENSENNLDGDTTRLEIQKLYEALEKAEDEGDDEKVQALRAIFDNIDYKNDLGKIERQTKGKLTRFINNVVKGIADKTLSEVKLTVKSKKLKNIEMKDIQAKLNKYNDKKFKETQKATPKVSEDGTYSFDTLKAIVDFQRDKGIKPSGMPDANFLEKLFEDGAE